MLYFEDFIEGVEGLPEEVKQKLTDIRILDLKARNIDDKLPNLRENFFKRIENNAFANKEERLAAQQALINDNEELTKLSEQKEEVAKLLYEKINKCCTKMQGELEKFKMELEADHPGVTDKIERDVLYSMTVGNGSLSRGERKRNRGRGISRGGIGHSSNTHHITANTNGVTVGGSGVGNAVTDAADSSHTNSLQVNPDSESRHLSLKIPQHNQISTHPERKRNRPGWDSPRTPNVDSLLSNRPATSPSSTMTGPGGDTDQNGGLDMAVVDQPSTTLHRPMSSSSLSRRGMSTSDYDSFEGHDNQVIYNGEESSHGHLGDSQFPILSPDHVSGLDSFAGDTWADSICSPNPHSSPPRQSRVASLGIKHEANHLYSGIDNSATSGLLNEEVEDEQVFCICRQVSFGHMVACDSPTCPYEWFHFSCVNLTSAPRGKWYCPNCRTRYQNVSNPCNPPSDVGLTKKRCRKRQ